MELPFYSWVETKLKKELDEIDSILHVSQSSIFLQDIHNELKERKTILKKRIQRVQMKAKGEMNDNSVAFIYTHLGLGDMFWMCGAVRYISTFYDKIILVCKKRYEKEVGLLYRDDPNIQLYVIEDDYVLEPFSEKRKEIQKVVTCVYGCGWFSGKEQPVIYDFPYSFYDDLDIPRMIRQEYFYYLPLEEGVERYKKISDAVGEKGYIVFHQQASHSTIEVSKQFDKEATLLLDVNKNLYPKEHPWYELAQSIVHQPLLSHISLFEHAKEIHMLESSVYCLVSHLNLSKVEKKVCYNAFQNSASRIGVFEEKEAKKLPPVV